MMADCQINNAEIYEHICNRYIDVRHRATDLGWSTDNIQIRLRSNLKEALEMGDTLMIELWHFRYVAPVVADDTIKETKTPEGLKSDILIYDPVWLEDTGA